MHRSLRALLVAMTLLLVGTMGLAGCKYLPAKTIDNPSEGTPEFLIAKVIEAAQKPDVMDGWTMLRPYLHSKLTELRSSEDNFLNFNFKSFRNKVRLFTTDDKGKPLCDNRANCYKLDYTREDQPDQEHQLFIVNRASDMPSPFRIARDPAANNEWRIKNIP